MKRNLPLAILLIGTASLTARAHESLSVFDQLEAMAGQKFSAIKVADAVPAVAAAAPEKGQAKLMPFGKNVTIRIKDLIVPAGASRVYVSEGRLYYRSEDFFPKRGWMAIIVSPAAKDRRVNLVIPPAVISPRASWSAPGYDFMDKAEGIESITIDPLTNGRFKDPTIDDFNGVGGGFVTIGPA